MATGDIVELTVLLNVKICTQFITSVMNRVNKKQHGTSDL